MQHLSSSLLNSFSAFPIRLPDTGAAAFARAAHESILSALGTPSRTHCALTEHALTAPAAPRLLTNHLNRLLE
jgi:hypothetical protein